MFWAAIITAIAVIVGAISAQFLGKDNPIEESCEAVIKEFTGLDIDLTPESTDDNQDAQLEKIQEEKTTDTEMRAQR